MSEDVEGGSGYFEDVDGVGENFQLGLDMLDVDSYTKTDNLTSPLGNNNSALDYQLFKETDQLDYILMKVTPVAVSVALKQENICRS